MTLRHMQPLTQGYVAKIFKQLFCTPAKTASDADDLPEAV